MIDLAIIFDERGLPITETNPFPVSVTGSNLVEQLTEADVSGGDLTFSAPVAFVEIVNTDATNAGTFTVNGIALTVPASTIVGPIAVGTTPAAVVSVTGATTYIVSRYA